MINAEYYGANVAQTNKLVHVVELDFTLGYAWRDMLVLYSEAHKKFYWASGESDCACCGFEWDDIESLDEMCSGTVADVIVALDVFWEENSTEYEGANYDSKEQVISRVETFAKNHLAED